VTSEGQGWLLLNASPDLTQQLGRTRQLRPDDGPRGSPIRGVVLTNGDVDHVAGLLSLRERHRFVIYATEGTSRLIRSNSIFRVLDGAYVSIAPLSNDVIVDTGLGLRITPFFVPGKVALHQEEGEVAIGGVSDATLGLEVEAGGKRLLYVPGCARISEDVLRRARGVDLLLFDGTTYTDDEMVRLGLSEKTAWRMGHMAISGPGGSLSAFDNIEIGRKVYTHINNTNPILVAGSPERLSVEAAGWQVAYDGMEIGL
jgi:pyrroloquinoline quinone biosynthesis protein B